MSFGRISSPRTCTLRIHDRWLRPKNSTYSSSSVTPSFCAIRYFMLLGASQMPITRWKPAACSACVTSPDGFVKLNTHALGAYCSIMRQ